MRSPMLTRFFAPLLAILALSSCILVDDFAPKWQEGKADSCTNKIAESLYYSEFRRDPKDKDIGALAHSFTLGKFHFLMLKKDVSDSGGRMYRFGVTNGIFQRYRLDPTMRKTFEEKYPNAPVSLDHDTVVLKNLSPEVIKLLTEISDQSQYWEIEDQTLYNTMRNPLCIFEDRDLKALAEADKPKTQKTATEKSKAKK